MNNIVQYQGRIGGRHFHTMHALDPSGTFAAFSKDVRGMSLLEPGWSNDAIAVDAQLVYRCEILPRHSYHISLALKRGAVRNEWVRFCSGFRVLHFWSMGKIVSEQSGFHVRTPNLLQFEVVQLFTWRDIWKWHECPCVWRTYVLAETRTLQGSLFTRLGLYRGNASW